LKFLLVPFAKLHGQIMDLRNAMYEREIFKSYPLGARTVSVGNLTLGGTGKTPLVELVAKILADSSEKVCILTRGYGRRNARERVVVSDGERVLEDAATTGDEPLELARKLLGKAIVIADRDRVSAAAWAKEKFGVTSFVLDDGFQHRKARRDLDIVCIDATDPWGDDMIIPGLREPPKGLKRADAIVVTRTNLVDSTEDLVEKLKRLNMEAPLFHAETHISGLDRFERHQSKKDKLEKSPLFGFCGLANPKIFPLQLKKDNFVITGFTRFPDHHVYNQADIELLETQARSSGAQALVTTAKDAVKLEGLELPMPTFIALAETTIREGAHFERIVLGKARLITSS
jgi:tetraacyldisaccharide 4'-kinase